MLKLSPEKKAYTLSANLNSEPLKCSMKKIDFIHISTFDLIFCQFYPKILKKLQKGYVMLISSGIKLLFSGMNAIHKILSVGDYTFPEITITIFWISYAVSALPLPFVPFPRWMIYSQSGRHVKTNQLGNFLSLPRSSEPWTFFIN